MLKMYTNYLAQFIEHASTMNQYQNHILTWQLFSLCSCLDDNLLMYWWLGLRKKENKDMQVLLIVRQ